MSSVMTSSAIVRRHPAPIAAVALAFTAAYTLAIGSAGGDRPPTRERANAVLARPATVTALRDVARLPALRRVKPPAPKPRAPVATRAAALSPSPVPVATATPPPPPPPAVTPQPAAPQPTPEPTFDSSG
jgi:hypothetical protein